MASYPIENSEAGGVGPTLDCLQTHQVFITGEAYMEVHHHCAAFEPLDRLTVIFAHPQTHEQCSDFLEELGIEVIHTSSNAASAQAMKEREHAGAIVSGLIARTYTIPLIRREVQNNSGNTTRFIVISSRPPADSNPAKCSILINPREDRPGPPPRPPRRVCEKGDQPLQDRVPALQEGDGELHLLPRFPDRQGVGGSDPGAPWAHPREEPRVLREAGGALMEVTLGKAKGIDLDITAPPSKSFTHRALVAAGLARGSSTIQDPLLSDDTNITATALKGLGVPLAWEEGVVRITGVDGRFPTKGETTLDLGESGTSMRFFAALALLAANPVVLRGSPRMHERPIGPLASALGEVGGETRYLGKDGFPPIRVSGAFRGGDTVVDGSISSQFVSALLMAAPCGDGDLTLTVNPAPVSRSYLDLTAEVMSAFGAPLGRDGYTRFHVPGGTGYRGAYVPDRG